jgi:hypothetical protein
VEKKRDDFFNYLVLANNLEELINNSDFKMKTDGYNEYICLDESLYHKLNSREMNVGEFLGYPKCCVDNFYSEECGKTIFPYRDFVIQTRKRNNLDSNLFYLLHAPCDIDCRETLKFAKEIRRVLEANDIEAANYLRNDRKNSFENSFKD